MADKINTRKLVGQWESRVTAAEEAKKTWETKYRVAESYQFWTGNQLAEPEDARGERRMQLNLVHSAVRSTIPTLYFYRPFVKITAAPERADTPGEQLDDQIQLLQDTGNYFVREGAYSFRESTMLAMKESMWAFGCVEVGYTADFIELDEAAGKPVIKESEWTKEDKDPKPDVEPVKDEDGLTVSPESDEQALSREMERLQSLLKSETFYVKHIPARQVLISSSDNPILENNDWIGYWEEHNLEDVKRSSYENTDDLKASNHDSTPNPGEKEGKASVVKLYKVWDLRSKVRYVFAEGHDKYLLKKGYQRCPLKFLRLDVDPYHFYPKPPISDWLMPQEEYNDSREYLRLTRKGTVPRFTVDENAVVEGEITKLESDTPNIYIKRRPNTSRPIEPVEQPTYAQNALQTLSVSEKEFNMIAGVPAEFRQTQEQKTATQAVIQSQQAQVQDSFDRTIVAEWLASVVHEILELALEHMLLDRWIGVNVDPDSPFAEQEAQVVAERYRQLTSEKLRRAAAGLRWTVQIDVESLSPVSEEEKLGRWMQAITLITNPQIGPLMALSPLVLKRTLELSGIKSGQDKDAIQQALQLLLAQQQQQAAMAAQAGGSPPAPIGIASQPGNTSPGAAATSPAPPVELPSLPGTST